MKNDYEKLTQAVVNAILEYIGYEVENESVYTVKSGDTLWNIAKKFNISVNDLKNENNLTNNFLSIGQKLIIPSKKTQGENVYTVKSGDTLYSIARKYGITMNELIEFNNLDSTLLSIGQTLKIPIVNSEEVPSTNDITYTVKRGDNLYSIARKYNVSVSDLMSYNNLTNNLLSIGQIIKIPSNGMTETIYIVQNGDTLYGIARKFNTTVDSIKRKNDLTSNILSIGQKLKI